MCDVVDPGSPSPKPCEPWVIGVFADKSEVDLYDEHNGLLAVTLRNAVPEIIEAFELLHGGAIVEPWPNDKWYADVAALLSKVSGT